MRYYLELHSVRNTRKELVAELREVIEYLEIEEGIDNAGDGTTDWQLEQLPDSEDCIYTIIDKNFCKKLLFKVYDKLTPADRSAVAAILERPAEDKTDG